MNSSSLSGHFVGWRNGNHLMTREIGIDMGHRVTNHASKCRNVHGHRYTVQATLIGGLKTQGEEEGMVMDFGFLKDEMLRQIDEPCDHGLCLWVEDPLLEVFFPRPVIASVPHIIPAIEQAVRNFGYWTGEWDGGKLYVIDKVPTAENLAEHWFGRLAPFVKEQTDGKAQLGIIRVFETPNCWADYVAP